MHSVPGMSHDDSHHDEHSHSDQDLISDGRPGNLDVEGHDEFASARAFMPLAVPGMGVPHPGSALASAEHIEDDLPDEHSDEPSVEGREPGREERLERR